MAEQPNDTVLERVLEHHPVMERVLEQHSSAGKCIRTASSDRKDIRTAMLPTHIDAISRLYHWFHSATAKPVYQLNVGF